MIFINITITISENGINYNVFQVKTKYKILTVSPRRRNSQNGDETTTANAPDRSSRAHACQCEFTSGSRPGSSRPAILRSLFLGRPLLRFPSRVQCRAVFAIEAFSQGTCPIRGRGVMQRNIGCRSLYWDELECSRAR